MKNKIILLLLLIISTNLYSDFFQMGNLEFTNKNYDKAIESYLEDLHENGNNINTLFNIGNTYLKLDKYGEALHILYKARLLYPRDKNINLLIKSIELDLDLENQFNNYKVISFKENWILTLFLLTILSIILFFVSFLSFRNRTNSIFYRLRKILIFSIILLLIISVTGNIMDKTKQNIGIILHKTEVLISPYNGSDNSYTAKEGRKVKITDSFDNYYFVSDEYGKYGWIAKQNIETLWK